MLVLVGLVALGCEGPAGKAGSAGTPGAPGDKGLPGDKGDPGTATTNAGSIAGSVKDKAGAPLAGVAIRTTPASATATSAADGTFTLPSIVIGSYSVSGSKAGYAGFTLVNVGVAAGVTTNVSLVLQVASDAPGTISGTVSESKTAPTPMAGVVVTVPGTTLTATTATNGTFTLSGVPPGPVFVAAAAPSKAFLETETREAVVVPPGGAVAGLKLMLSARPSDTADYVGMNDTTGCSSVCHSGQVSSVKSSAHNRSLTRISRDGAGNATAGAWTRLLNPTITNPRTVMIPLLGTIAVPGGVSVVGTGTAFQSGGAANAIVPGDKLGYTPKGLGWTQLGVVQSVDSDTQLTLAAGATFAPTVTSLPANTKYSVARLSSGGHTHMWPEDATDIVAPAWPGVKATNPNYDPNDPQIYAASGAYADGQVNVYLCNLKGATVQGVAYTTDEFVQKFGGNPYTCSDGSFWDGTTTPTVPLVHMDVIYGGAGDKDGNAAKHANMGVFKQRFQGRLADIKAAATWTYSAPPAGYLGGKAYDSLTLPIQILESGDKVNGGFKMNGYHPTEQKFPGESWTQRTRTFSHACAGCHATGMKIAWTEDATTQIHLQVPRDGTIFTMDNAAITAYNFKDENLTCEHCHGPGSEHVAAGGGRGKGIINPALLTAEAERQLCGKCHAYDDAVNSLPAQEYGFEYPWNSGHAAEIGGGNYVPGVYQIPDFFGNWDERTTDDEAFWDPARTGGKLYGQAHRQQYVMLSFAKHTNNPYEKLTCSTCHSPHTTFLGSRDAKAANGDAYTYATADFRNNVLCLSCHAGFGPFAAVTKDHVAAIHMASGGTATKNGAMAVASETDTQTAEDVIAGAVSDHMRDKASMSNAIYNPTNDASPVGRCTSCHMPKVAKSGGYTTGLDADGNNALVEGDQASHVFDIVWPYQSTPVSRGGPSFQSGYYGQFVSGSNQKYDMFGAMPNSCSKCHTGARKASLLCLDQPTVWPTFWPFNEGANRSFLGSNCFTSKTAP